jgi:hypothetical protein
MEAAGDSSQLLALCGDDIEFWPPDGPPAVGRDAIVARLHCGEEKIQSIEVSNCCVRGSNEIGYLTAWYKTTLTSPDTVRGRQIGYSGDVNGLFRRDVKGHSGHVNKVGA